MTWTQHELKFTLTNILSNVQSVSTGFHDFVIAEINGKSSKLCETFKMIKDSLQILAKISCDVIITLHKDKTTNTVYVCIPQNKLSHQSEGRWFSSSPLSSSDLTCIYNYRQRERVRHGETYRETQMKVKWDCNVGHGMYLGFIYDTSVTQLSASFT